ncbi:hypothetical protein PPS11_33672 [Pseudomonas putida S11]|nr:hypothetical protein PPS11_33672 [Pseudomonas putida S11]
MGQGIDDPGRLAFQIEVFGNGFAGIPVQPVDVHDMGLLQVLVTPDPLQPAFFQGFLDRLGEHQRTRTYVGGRGIRARPA